jgi:hypothetical protein
MKINRVDVSENISWIFQKGSWFIHILLTLIIKLSLSLFVSENTSWQWCIILYNLITFYFFHWKVGDPFSQDYYNYTFWEQIVEQSEDTKQVRFLALYPAILFVIINKIIYWDNFLLYIYILTLIMVTVPKLSFMHHRRIFGLRSLN